MNIEKLKNKARKLELKDQPAKAIEAYLELIQALEGTPELDEELALYNKVGDLYLKVRNVNGAVEMYERAVNRYAEGGYPNNAIALCNKILRSAPGRNHIYLTLAQLMVQRGFVAEAKKNFVEYAQRMSDAGKLDEAFEALKRFADISPENEEIRLMLADQLRAAAKNDDAREQIDKLMEGGGRKDTKRASQLLEKVRAVDPEYDVEGATAKTKSEDLIFIPLDDEPPPDRRAGQSPGRAASSDTAVEAAEPEAEEADGTDVEVGGLETSVEFDTSAAADVRPLEIEATTESGADEDLSFLASADTTTGESEDTGDIDVPHLDLDTAFEDTERDEGLVILNSGEEVGVADAELEDEEQEAPEAVKASVARPAEVPDNLMLIEVDDVDPMDLAAASAEVEARERETPESRLRALESAVEDDPDNPHVHREFAEALIESGERERGLAELDQALQRYEARRAWSQAADVAEGILRLEPNSVTHHQKRVEYAYRLGEKPQLVNAYMSLGNALFRSGALDRARAIYERVLEHDPDNGSARDAIANLTPVEPEPLSTPSGPRQSGYVDLGELILDDDAQKDTRLRVEEDEPSGDEQRDFDEMLQQFKRGIEENLDDEDSQAHYDLGVAFKEMGLLDEAIAEFQKALRSPDTRLASAEMLGLCFIEKGQHEVAATVLRRAVEGDPSTDGDKVGVLYWLARCEEEKSRYAEALVYYRRVFAVDIHFQDVGRRVDALVKAAGG